MTRIFHAHLWGTREDKYQYLESNDFSTIEWIEIFPKSPFHFFVPQNENLFDEYQKGWKIIDCMPVYSVGIVTARDNLTIQWSFQDIKDTIKDFISISVEEARKKYSLGNDTRDWKVSLAQDDIRKNYHIYNLISSLMYRPFDKRFTYYTGKSRGFICMPRPEVMSHFLNKENIGFYTCRQTISESWQHLLVSNQITDDCYVSNKSRERGYLFPLYLYPNTQNEQGSLFVERTPNFSSDFINTIRKKLGYLPTPEAIFYYIYAIFYSPTYRQRYAEFLKIDFPRVPLTSNDKLFKALSNKGQELVDLHLMKSSKLDKLITKISGEGDNAVTEVTYKPLEK